MIWMAVGCRYKEASLELRERLTFSSAQVPQALTELHRRYPQLEVVILSTCNRVEIYAAMELGGETNAFPKTAMEGTNVLVNFLAEFHGLKPETISPYLFRKTGRDVVEHLFLVASSLDSIVIGEGQIAGQVRAAYELAVDCGTVGPLLHSAFQRAAATVKKVTTETPIHKYRTSVASVAVSCFARQIFERLSKKTALVIGAGQMAEETLRYLRDEGIGRILIINRSTEKAERLADEFNGTPLPWDKMDEAMVQADMVISLTGATEPVVTLARFKAQVAKRDYRPLLILDLAVPRDFEPAIAAIPNVYLYTVDDLQRVCDENQAARNQAYPAARALIQQELEHFVLDAHHRKSARVIVQLHQRWHEIKEAERERLFSKLPELTEHEKQTIDYTLERILNKLLHTPLESLHEEAGGGMERQQNLLNAIRRLFDI